MLHLTSCERIGKIGDPTQADISGLREYLISVEAENWRSSGLIGVKFDRPEWKICLTALRIVSEL